MVFIILVVILIKQNCLVEPTSYCCIKLSVGNFIMFIFWYWCHYGLGDRGSRLRFLAWAGNFPLHHRVQNGSGALSASCPTGTRGSSSRGKAARTWSWPLTSI